MTMPYEFALLHYGKEIFVLANCIQDLFTNLLISCMVFVSDVQTPHLEGLDSSFLLLSGSSFHMHIGRRVR